MGALTIQIMILVASFLFYRILKSGFDSWKAIFVDFGIVLFLFGLQYYLQIKQENSDTNAEVMFPAGPISSFFGANFPSKISTFQTKKTNNKVCLKPEYGCYLKLSQDTFVQPKERKILSFNDQIKSKNIWNNNQFYVNETGFYIIQFSCDTDTIPYSAKLSIQGEKNQLDKAVHNGENSFVVYLIGEDRINFELENPKYNVMIHDTSTLYVIKI